MYQGNKVDECTLLRYLQQRILTRAHCGLAPKCTNLRADAADAGQDGNDPEKYHDDC